MNTTTRISEAILTRSSLLLVGTVLGSCFVSWSGAEAQTEDVVWTAGAGVSIAGSDLTKTATTGWGNAGAASLQSVESNGFVEFSGTETMMIGLSYGDTNQNYADIDFGILLWAGAYYVYESGTSRGSFGAPAPGDRFRVEVASSVVRYRRNGVVFYTSTLAPRSPLLVDAALYSTGSASTDVTIGRTTFTKDAGLKVSDRTLVKTATTGWNAGAVSALAIPSGDAFVEFSALETSKTRAAGLSTGDTDQSLGDIDFAIVLEDDATIEIQESGVSRGSFGAYSAGDRFSVEALGGTVRYYRNTTLLYTSAVNPSYPLVADTALYDTESTLDDLVVSDLVWTAGSGVTLAGRSLVKSGSAGWNAGAASSASLEGDGFVEFTAIETDTLRMCGLGHDDTTHDDTDIDFAIQLTEAGEVKVYESGTLRGTYGTYLSGDRFRVELQLGGVKYRKNGVVFYTSTVSPTYPLAVDTSLYTPGATLSEVRLGYFAWSNEVGVAVQGYGLRDTASTGWGNSGATTTVELQSGDGYAEFTATSRTTWSMLGLSNGNANASYTDIDFAIAAGNGSVYVYESGTSRGSFGTYAIGDRLRAAVEGGVVRYRKNGTLLYTSALTPQYPLLVDTALYSANVVVADVYFEGDWGPAQVATPTFSPGGATYTTPQTVAISCATAFVEIRYTTDGTEPTVSSTLHTAPLSLGTSTTLKAKAWKTGLSPSNTATAVYQMNFGTLTTPTLDPAPGAYTSSVDVTIAANPGSEVHYTTDGSTPTEASAPYTGPVTLAATSTLKAKAWQVDYQPSAEVSGAYTVHVAEPVFSRSPGSYPAGTTVELISPTPGATIHYTLDGDDPSAADPTIVSGDELVFGSFTLKARGIKSGCVDSGVTSAGYSVTGSFTAGAVAGGELSSLALRTDGTVWSWGANDSGQLGDGTTTPSFVPIRVSGLAGVTAIAAGGRFGVALRHDGTVWTWGRNTDRQLGDGTNTTRHYPVVVPGLEGVVAVTAGAAFAAALRADGTVWTWGDNYYGQTGTGDTTDRSSPVQVLSGVSQVAAGGYHVLSRKTDGTVWTWGRNSAGQIGGGTAGASHLTPEAVPGISTAVLVGAGGHHSFAALSDGSLFGWGENGSGNLGDGTTTDRYSPVLISGMTNVVALAGGVHHSLAVAGDGTVWSWGDNYHGQIGDGTTTDRLTPWQVSALTGVSTVAGGDTHSLALASDGTIWAWGRNHKGQLGDGTDFDRWSPVSISEGEAWRVATPDLAPRGGAYTAVQTVTVSVLTAGATIHYTTSGADPTEADPVIGSGGTVLVDQSLTLKAKAWKAGMPASNVAEAVYALTVATPTLTPGQGTYQTTQNVTVGCTVPGVTIHYTTNGAEPTTGDPTVAVGGTIVVDATQTVKAKAWRTGWTPSATVSKTYTMVVAPATLDPPGGSYTTAQSVTVLTVTPGATLRYTTSGLEPTTSDAAIASGTPLLVDRSLTLRVKGWKAGWTTAATTTASYFVPQGVVAGLAFDPAPGSYSMAQTVAVTTTTPDAVIRYALDGSVPEASSPAYEAPILVDSTTTVTARAFKAGWLPSPATSGTYSIESVAVATPLFNPPGGAYAAGRSVAVSVATAGSTVHYTTSGLDPTESDPVIASGGSIPLTRSTRLKARAWKAGLDPSPVATADFAVVGAITAGAGHTVLLRSGGDVWAWGWNANGQVGDGGSADRRIPVALGLADVVAVAAGRNHTLAVKADGTVWAWGDNFGRQLGDGTSTDRATPVQVLDAQGPLTGVVAVSGGSKHSMALKADGSVWTWGENSSGALGDGTWTDRGVAAPVPGLDGVTAISAGGTHCLALQTSGGASGSLWVWGGNTHGQVADGTLDDTNRPLKIMDDVRALAAGINHTLVIRADGTAWGAGRNDAGQLGDGTTDNRSTFGPAFVGLSDVLRLSASDSHTLALTADGRVWSSGLNNYGQLGDGTKVDKTSPVRAVWLEDVVDLTAGRWVSSPFVGYSGHSAALTADGRVWTWGSNFRGQLGTGDGLNDHRYRPTPLLAFWGADQSWPTGDEDGDGLTNAEELELGTDPLNPDTNGDGLLDFVAVRSGQSATDPDMDGDGVSNVIERIQGTDPLRADTDGDGVGDGTDCFPLDPSRSTCPASDPSDVTPPSIALTEPSNAILVGTTP